MPNFISTGISIGGVHSNTVGVMLVKVGSSGLVPTLVGAGRSVKQERVSGVDTPWFYRTDVEDNAVDMTFTLHSATPTLSWADLSTRQAIYQWIYGSRGYVDVISDDDTSKVYKMIFTSPLQLETANLSDGYFTVSASCLPHAYTVQSATPVTISSTPTTVSITNNQNVMNADMTYNYYPTLTIVPSGSSFKWTNTSDSNRIFELSPVVPGETIVLNAKNKTITGTSSTNLIASLTNKAWPRLVAGANSIQFNTTGTCTITTQFPVLR